MACEFSSGYVLRRPPVVWPTFWKLAGWLTHEKLIWKVSQLLLVVLIPATLNMTPGQRFKLLRSWVPRSMYSEKLVIIVWFIVSSYMLHFCWHCQSCIDSTQSVSHLVVSWQSLVLVSSDIPLCMYMDMSHIEVSFLGSKRIYTLSEETDTTFSDIPILMIGDNCLVHSPHLW